MYRIRFIQNGPRKSSPPSVFQVSLLLCLFLYLRYATDPGYFFVAHPEGRPQKSSPGPQHSVNTEINRVARTRAKRKEGYFFVAHSVYFVLLPEVDYLKSQHVAKLNI